MAVTRGKPDVQALGGLKDGLAGNRVHAFLGSEGLVSNAIQSGSITLGTGGTSGWAIFAKPFTNAPVVVASMASGALTSAIGAGSGWIYVNNINTGSAQILCGIGSGGAGHTGGPVLDWIAFGTY